MAQEPTNPDADLNFDLETPAETSAPAPTATSTPAPIQAEKKEEATVNEDEDSGLHFGLGLSYGINSRMKSDPVIFPAGHPVNETTTFEGQFSRAVAFEVEIRYLKANSIGVIGSFISDQNRKIDTFKFTGVSTVWTPIDSWKPKMDIQVSTFNLSAAFRASEVYFFLGVNLPQIKITSDDDGFGEFTTTPSIGWQAGLGYYVTQNFLLELSTRQIYFTTKSKYSNDAEIDFGKSMFSNSFLTAKFIL